MAKRVYIAGAHSRAQTVAFYLTYLDDDMEIEAYLIDNQEQNPEFVKGVPVIRIGAGVELHKDYPVYIGTRGVNFQHFTEVLEQLGMKEIHPVTMEFDLMLRNAFLSKYFDSMGRKFEKIDEQESSVENGILKENISTCVFVANSVYDSKLQQEYQLAPYEKIIQVGASLTEKRIAENILTDNIGENISAKNRQFCELTALFWIWKNAKEDIVGLVHYRRHFILPKDWSERMLSNEIDVILPLPLYVSPTLEDNYKSRHDPSDLDFLMEYLKENLPEDYKEVKNFFGQNLYSPCNMFIMRKEILDELCQWMFPILNAVVAHGGEKEDNYFNRYPGFLSERLITYYFEKNINRYKVVYADKNFLN